MVTMLPFLFLYCAMFFFLLVVGKCMLQNVFSYKLFILISIAIYLQNISALALINSQWPLAKSFYLALFCVCFTMSVLLYRPFHLHSCPSSLDVFLAFSLPFSLRVSFQSLICDVGDRFPDGVTYPFVFVSQLGLVLWSAITFRYSFCLVIWCSGFF